MCTVTWRHQPERFELFCNRDERLMRLPASPPEIRELRGVRYIAPADGEAGGSWIGVNEFGVGCCLLNVYIGESEVDRSAFTSRGLLVVDLLDSRSTQEVTERLAHMRLDQYQPFLLALFEPDAAVTTVRWDGTDCRVDEIGSVNVPLVSSGWEFERVRSSRAALLDDMVRENGGLDRTTLERFHRSHIPEKGPESVCMHREDAQTISLSIVTIAPDAIEFHYEAGPPCDEQPSVDIRVLRS